MNTTLEQDLEDVIFKHFVTSSDAIDWGQVLAVVLPIIIAILQKLVPTPTPTPTS